MLDASEVEDVRRYSAENGVSIEQAWADRVRWQTDAEIAVGVRRVVDSERAVTRLESELQAARAELAQYRRQLAAARRRRDNAASVRPPRCLRT